MTFRLAYMTVTSLNSSAHLRCISVANVPPLTDEAQTDRAFAHPLLHMRNDVGTYHADTPAGSAFGRKTNCGGCNGSFKQVSPCFCSFASVPLDSKPVEQIVVNVIDDSC
jgi:hypothetical protein